MFSTSRAATRSLSNKTHVHVHVPSLYRLQRHYAKVAAAAGTFAAKKNANGNYMVSLIPGDGIGPEISKSVVDIFRAAKIPIEWEEIDVTPTLIDGKTSIPPRAIESVRRNTIALKGPLATPVCFSLRHQTRRHAKSDRLVKGTYR